MKIVTIVGARPQFVKCAAVSREIRKDHTEWVETLHDGWNVLTGSDEKKILFAIEDPVPPRSQRDLYPSGSNGKIRGTLRSGDYTGKHNE